MQFEDAQSGHQKESPEDTENNGDSEPFYSEGEKDVDDTEGLGTWNLKLSKPTPKGDAKFKHSDSSSPNRKSAKVNQDQAKESDFGVCKICLSPDDNPINPLIYPWKCEINDIKIHLLCMKEWLNKTRKVVTTMHSVSYFWKLNYWNICQEEYKHEMSERPDSNFEYIILESVNSLKYKTIHILSVDKRDIAYKNKYMEFTIGGDSVCDVRMTSKYISPIQAKIIIRDGSFYINDWDSKFGTYIELNKPILILPKERVNFVYGKVMVKVQSVVQHRWWWWKDTKIVVTDNSITPKIERTITQNYTTRPLNESSFSVKSLRKSSKKVVVEAPKKKENIHKIDKLIDEFDHNYSANVNSYTLII